MKVVAVLQARMSSSRLPEKVLMPILGKPMLLHQIERVIKAKSIDKLVVATSRDSSDDPIQAMCIKENMGFFRGELDDVLDRFYQAALSYSPDYVVRLTGDCPLSDPQLIDEVINFCVEGDFDYASNVLPPTYPDGFDVEVVRFEALEQAWLNAKLPSEREHVLKYIYQRPEQFRLGNYSQVEDRSKIRVTVDHVEDFNLVEKIFEKLYPRNNEFNYADVMSFLDSNPGILQINNSYSRNEGAKKSLVADEAYKKLS